MKWTKEIDCSLLTSLTFHIDVYPGGQVGVLGFGSIEAFVRSSEFCSGAIHLKGADIPTAPGHVAFVFGKSGLPVHRFITFTSQI